MSGPPLPFGHPWHVNVGRNPNINRDPPPPPVDGIVHGTAPAGHILVNGAPPTATSQVFQVQAPPSSTTMLVDGGMPPTAMSLAPPFGMAMGFGLDPFGGYPMGMNLGMGMYGAGSGGLAPPQLSAYINPKLYNSMGGLTYNGMGYGGMGIGFPPPPLGPGGIPPPFSPGNPLWTSSNALNPLGMGMGMGMGMAPGLGMNLYNANPEPSPPLAHNNGQNNGPIPPPQPDITVIPGGQPPGATTVAAEEYTIVIVLKTMTPPWLQPLQPMVCESLNLDSNTSLNRLIHVCRENEDCDGGWAITECIELGNGYWEKGITFVHGTPTAITGTLKGVGWTNARNRLGGQSLHVFCHKV